MTWIFLAILAHFIWAVSSIGEKYLVSKRIDPYVYTVWFAFFGLAIGLLMLPFVDIFLLRLDTLLWLTLCGALYFYGGLPYIKAMQIEEPTRISIWWNTIPIFSLFLGFIFFKESFSSIQLIAFIFLVSGAFAASIHFKQKNFVFSKAVILMIMASFCYALYAVIFHHAVQGVSFVSAFVVTQLSMFIFALTLFLHPGFRKIHRKEYKNINKNIITLVGGVSALDILGMFFNQWALVFGVAALVFAMEGSQMIFVFIIATLLSIFYPRIVKEKLDKKNILLKLTALMFMIVGILILNLG
ncbi:hypothetical protein C0581_02215 [Candidatus Parcubacteria bacterium]|nr:MAG: hypothetical protein C0581_02215 [Candidatus Parcubacteria bacterium]